MKKYIFYILVISSIVSCSRGLGYDYKIKQLQHKDLSYNELPKEVHDYLSLITRCDTSLSDLAFVNPVDSSRFRFMVVKSIFVDSWIAYYKLIDIDKNIIYRIEQGEPSPYIIFDNKLYIPDRFNTLYIGDVDQARYTEYELKNEICIDLQSKEKKG